MKNRLTLDGAGRIVLPQPVRRQFHLARGATLDLEVGPDVIVLRPPARQAAITDEGGLLVHEGTPTGDLLNAVEDSRERRNRQITGQLE